MTTTWTARHEPGRASARRGLGAAALSTLVPGVGQVAVGHRREGAVLLTFAAGLGGVAVWLALEHTRAVLAWMLRPSTLWWMLAMNAALLAFRLAATLGAYRAGAGERGASRSRPATTGIVVVLALLAGFIVVPHAIAAYWTAQVHGVMAAVFAGDASSGAPLEPAPAPQPSPIPPGASPEPTLSAPDPGPDPTPSPTPDVTTPDVTVPDPNPWAQERLITIALLGSDAAPGRSGDRLDSMAVVAVVPATGASAVFSIPRNTRGFPLPDDLMALWQRHCQDGTAWELLNSFYQCMALRAPAEVAALYPNAADPAAAAMRTALGELLGIPVTHHALVNMSGFVSLVDALGGVDVYVAQPIRTRLSPPSPDHSWQVYDIPSGMQHLDGAHALAFVRSRTGSSDDERMRRQRCLLASLAGGADVTSVVRNLPAVLRAVEELVTTNIPVQDVPDLLDLVGHLDGGIATVCLGAPEFQASGNRPRVDDIHAAVWSALWGPAATGPSEQAGDPDLVPAACR